MTNPTIGFIGLGLMGSAMVECLQASGYQISVMANRSRGNIDAAVARGAIEVTTAAQVAAGADIIMLCMSTSEQVESRVFGADGVLAGLKPGSVVIDFGTSLPASTTKIGAAINQKSADYLDAPLGRTPAHAKDGLLNIMCSGDEKAFEKVRTVLAVLGENVFHLGALGTGHTIKLINNFYGMTTACAMSEAFSMADRAGIDRDKLYQVMAAGPLHSGMMDFVKSYATDGKIDLAFSVANASKDVNYYGEMANDLGAASKMSGAARDLLEQASADGWGQRMVPELVDYLSRQKNEA